MIFIDDEIDRLSRSEFEKLLDSVSVQRREKIDGYKFLNDKIQSLLAYSLLQKALLKLFSVEEPPFFILGKSGKPFLRDYPDIYFNLSHCAEAVACAIEDRAVGIDIEAIKEIDWDLAAYICNEKELKSLKNANDPSLDFSVLWTKKESLCKCKGLGLPEKLELKNLESQFSKFDFETIVNMKKKYVVTSCRATYN